MKLTEILEKAGKHKRRHRVGRGPGSGSGKTSGRGHKGAKARSGYKRRVGYEGGQMSIIRRLPKRGFSNEPFRVRFDVVNLWNLAKWFEAGDTIDLETLVARGLIAPRHGRLKVLGSGELSKKLTVVADGISAAAREKIEAAGGQVEITGASGAAAKRKG